MNSRGEHAARSPVIVGPLHVGYSKVWDTRFSSTLTRSKEPQVIWAELGDSPVAQLATLARAVILPALAEPAATAGVPAVLAQDVAEKLHRLSATGATQLGDTGAAILLELAAEPTAVV